MSKLEIALVVIIILIVGGVGAYKFKDKIFNSSASTTSSKKVELGETQKKQDQTPDNFTRVKNKCENVLKRCLAFEEHCEAVWTKSKELARKCTDASIRSIKSQSIADKESYNACEREASVNGDLRTQCVRFNPNIEKAVLAAKLVTPTGYIQAERLCLEVEIAIPPGF